MEILRKNQKEMPEIKDTETEMKNDGFISRLEMADVRISELEGISIKPNIKTTGRKAEQNIYELRDNYKRSNTYVMEIQEREEREKGSEHCKQYAGLPWWYSK